MLGMGMGIVILPVTGSKIVRIVAAPFVVVMVGMCVSLYLDLSRDPLVADLRRKAPESVNSPL